MNSAARRRLFSYGIVVHLAIELAFPFFWLAVTSFKYQGDVYNEAKTWNFHPTLENYGYLFHDTGYLRWIRNSCFVGLVVVLITLVVAVPAGYALARLAGRLGRGLGVAIFLTTSFSKHNSSTTNSLNHNERQCCCTVICNSTTYSTIIVVAGSRSIRKALSVSWNTKSAHS